MSSMPATPSTPTGGTGKGNRHSTLSFFSPLSKYFSSEWSFAHFTLPVECRCVCAFAATDRGDEGPAAAARRALEVIAARGGDAAVGTSAGGWTTGGAAGVERPSVLPFVTPPGEDAATGGTAGKPGFPEYRSDGVVNGRWSPGPVVEATAVVILCSDGTAFKCWFDAKKGGEMVVENFTRFYRGVGVEAGGDGGEGTKGFAVSTWRSEAF
ncbi:hypothetical protein HK101_011457 [Irineochytrium annulatum]|nr:hypothetical protein HK101_011457 [Irineochytrium annulatum]